MARVKYVAPSGVSSKAEFLEYASKRMQEALKGNMEALSEVGALMSDKGQAAFDRWLSSRPQPIDGVSILDFWESVKTADRVKAVISGTKASTRGGVFQTPDGVVLEIIVKGSADDEDEETA